MKSIIIRAPSKSDTRYAFECDVSGKTTVFGFETVNYKIAHHWAWDSIFPAIRLLHVGLPVGGYAQEVAIKFTYAIHVGAAEFLTALAYKIGVRLVLQAETFDRPADLQTSGTVIPIGGGKDSRLLMGIATELGYAPKMLHARETKSLSRPTDVPGCLFADCIDWTLTNRLMPAIMLCPAALMYGASVEYCYKTQPWHMYFDLGGHDGRQLYEALFRRMSLPMKLLAPLSVLPSNQIQRILCLRYPDLAKHQVSTSPNEASDKNLHISLIKLMHSIPINSNCSEELFRRLVSVFIKGQLRNPPVEHDKAREFFVKEMRGAVHRLRDHPLIRENGPIPDEWQATWFDYVHEYACPDVTDDFLRVFYQYLPSMESAPVGTERIET